MIENLIAQIHNMPTREFYEPLDDIDSWGDAIFAVIIFGISGYLMWRLLFNNGGN